MIGYRPQLDSLRAIAVAPVLIAHFWLPGLHLSTLGVRLFFVLSGFLLTSILLNERQNARSANRPRLEILRNFYIRRILRIWPAYYALLLGALALGVGSIVATFWWHALFASNILFFVEQRWYPGLLAHLWTLAVEEQFYLVLPIAVLFVPPRLLRPLMIASIVLAVLFRATLGAFVSGSLDFYFVLPIAQLDALGAGALLAIHFRDGRSLNWKSLLIWSVPLALAFYFVPLPNVLGFSIGEASHLLPMVALVSGASIGIGGAAGALLGNRGLVAIGRISYGIYLYHNPVGAALNEAARSILGHDIYGTGFAFVLFSAATIAIAAASWLLVERPLLALKRRFSTADAASLIPAAPTRI